MILSPRLLLPLAGAALAAPLAISAPAPAPEPLRPPARNAGLISIDSLRADHLEPYGYPRATMPRLAGLLARRGGTVYRRATAVSPSCHPSHTAMLTGLYPQQVGVPWCGEDLLVKWSDLDEPQEIAELEAYQERLRAQPPRLRQKRLSAVRNWLRIPPGQDSLPGRLRGAGFRTLGATSIWTVTSRFGYAEGFDRYRDETPEYYGPRSLSWLLRDTLGSQMRQVAAATIDAAIDELDRLDSGQRFFLFVNLADTHVPYDARGSETWSARAPDRERMEAFWSRRYPGDSWERAKQAMTGRDGFLLDRYDDAIRATDAQIARLLDALARRGVLDDTLIVVTSDHGDSFGQHAYLSATQAHRLFFEHSVYVWEETQHVPLFVMAPGDPPGLRVREVNASLVDLEPTILAGLGLEERMIRAGPGADLASLPEGPRIVYFLTFGRGQPGLLAPTRLDYPKFVGLRRGDLKFFVDRERFRDPGAGRCFLYDLAADPNELRDLCPERPEEATRLRALLVDWYTRSTAGRDAAPQRDAPSSEDVRETPPRRPKKLDPEGDEVPAGPDQGTLDDQAEVSPDSKPSANIASESTVDTRILR